MTTRTASLLPLLLLLLAPTAGAGLILQPKAASTNMGTSTPSSPDFVRDQSGLRDGYTSLVTDFDTYIAGNPTHDSGSSFSYIWLSTRPTGVFDFALGGTFTIQSLALWNFGSGATQNVRRFLLVAADNDAFSNPTFLGSFDADPNTGGHDAVLPQVFTFTPTSAAFVRMEIVSNNGDFLGTIFGEAAFELQVVPEPASLTLMASAGVVVLAGAAWRRQRTRTAVAA